MIFPIDGLVERRHGASEKTGRRRDASRNAGHAHSQNTGFGTSAWPYHRPCHPAHIGRRTAGGTGVALSSPAPPGRSRMALFAVGPKRKQSQGQVLSIDRSRQEAAHPGSQPLAEDGAGDWPRDGQGSPSQAKTPAAGGRAGMSLLRFFRRRRSDEEVRREMEHHLAQEYDDNVESGMHPEAARRRAYLEFGSPRRVREDLWSLNSIASLERLARDLRY